MADARDYNAEERDYIERLFVHDVDHIPHFGRTGYHYNRLLLSGILRRLVIDGGKLAHLANREHRLQLLVLMVEPESGNVPRDQLLPVTDAMLKYASPLSEAPPGFYHRPYHLDEYLENPAGAAFGRDLTRRKLIKLISNKLGGVHMDRDFTEEPLYTLNKGVKFFGEGLVYHLFDGIAHHIYAALMPLRDAIFQRRQGDVGFPRAPDRNKA